MKVLSNNIFLGAVLVLDVSYGYTCKLQFQLKLAWIMTVFSFSLLFKELKDLETQKESLEIQNEESIMSYYKMRQQINRLGDEMLVGVALIVVNPVTPKIDQHLISPYNNTLESDMNVMRIEEMITN